MGLVLDTGGLIAFERGDRRVAALIEATRRRRDRVVTSSGCVAQAWRRGGAPQVLLARLLAGTVEAALDPGCSRAVGELCAAAGLADVVDAHVALLASDHDTVLTSDAGDLAVLLRAGGRSARTAPC